MLAAAAMEYRVLAARLALKACVGPKAYRDQKARKVPSDPKGR